MICSGSAGNIITITVLIVLVILINIFASILDKKQIERNYKWLEY
jgi:hypothetical protein